MRHWSDMSAARRFERSIDLAVEIIEVGDWVRFEYTTANQITFQYQLQISNVLDSEDGRGRTIIGTVLYSNDPDHSMASDMRLKLDRAVKTPAYLSSHSYRLENMTVPERQEYMFHEIKNFLLNDPVCKKKMAAKPKVILHMLRDRGYFKADLDLTSATTADYKNARTELKRTVLRFGEFLGSDNGKIFLTISKTWDTPKELNIGRKAPVRVNAHGIKMAFSMFANGFIALLDSINVVEIVDDVNK